MNSFAVVDCETTGLDRQTDRIIEIAVIQLSQTLEEEAQFHTLVNPQRPVSASFIHGITDADVATAPTFTQIMPHLISLLTTRIIVAHNFPFDRGFLNHALAMSGARVHIPQSAGVDTLDQSRIYLPNGSHSLINVAARLGLHPHEHHRALADTLITADIFREFVAREARGERYNTHAYGRHGAVLPAQWERATPWRP
ncbi:PolC-type DNA polymerase III [Arcanobacterium canis]|uniref:3'-5' exonuclease n=1 Tax=Arcanobacterium canis TaxID=999183 RepID=A0ABY8FW21_9ACTO|nr:3'-5' exonuclease [Arcanobacterium canis]WFM82714.1 3'-5' exonuclease [Arcanobacterium canis]